MSVREFLLPDLGEGLEDAEVQAWHVAEGDRVELNQTLVEVNTAKAVVEIPAPWAGVVQRLHAGEGEVVKVGHPLVSIQVEDGALENESAEAQQPEQEVGLEAARDQNAKPTWGSTWPRCRAPALEAGSPGRTWNEPRRPENRHGSRASRSTTTRRSSPSGATGGSSPRC